MIEGFDSGTHCCLICGAIVEEKCKVDFSKSCEDAKGPPLAPTGKLISYVRCAGCGHFFAPEMVAWTAEQLSQHVYNDSYILVDPEYTGARSFRNARMVFLLFKDRLQSPLHLDYGGGDGKMCAQLVGCGWNSVCFDPFANRNGPAVVGKFDVITAFEVFEHAGNPHRLLSHISEFLKDDAVVLMSTILTDEYLSEVEDGSWWYLAPRNGHISLFSRRSLDLLALRHGLQVASIADGLHIMARESVMERWSFLHETGICPWDLANE